MSGVANAELPLFAFRSAPSASHHLSTFPSVNNCNILYRYLNYYFVSIIFLIFVQAIHKALTKGGIDDERSDSESCADDNDDDVTEQKKEQ